MDNIYLYFQLPVYNLRFNDRPQISLSEVLFTKWMLKGYSRIKKIVKS
jgi:hypothetical protein